MLKRILIVTTILSSVMLCVLFFSTTPSSIGPLGILGLFVFMYLSALGVLTFLFKTLNAAIVRILPKKHRNIVVKDLPLHRAYYYASVVALVPVMLIAIQSVDEVGVYQVLLITFFVIVAWAYVTNRAS